MTKQQLAAAAVHQIADALKSAPRTPTHNMPMGAEELLESLLDATLVGVAPDPTSSDGYVDICKLCGGEPHDSYCPLGMLEEIRRVGMFSAEPISSALGLRGVEM